VSIKRGSFTKGGHGKKEQSKVCISNFWLMYYFHYELWSLDVKSGCGHFCCCCAFLKWQVGEPCHVTIGFFEIIKTFGNARLCKWVICLQNMGLVFVSLHNMSNMKENLIFPAWPPLWLLLCLVKFWGCWHLFWGLVKAIQCPSDVTVPWKTSILIKKTQSILQKTITRTKKSGKGWWEWLKTC
jgi:hypothetical protein